MKYLAAYWVVGCVLAGIGMGSYSTRCPKDEYFSSTETLTFVATWPAVLGAAFTWRGEKSACKAQ